MSAPVALGEAGVALSGDDNVIEDGDAAKVTDLAEALGELDVLARRGRITRGMVVGEDDGGDAGSDELAEYVSRMNLDAS